jgi:hypothetical protein
MTNSELEKYTKDDLAIMRNEIYARHGYIFNDNKFKSYFIEKEWYKPYYVDVSFMLSIIENRNIELIKSYEKMKYGL